MAYRMSLMFAPPYLLLYRCNGWGRTIETPTALRAEPPFQGGLFLSSQRTLFLHRRAAKGRPYEMSDKARVGAYHDAPGGMGCRRARNARPCDMTDEVWAGITGPMPEYLHASR